MKKLLLMLFALLTTAGAWATDVTVIQSSSDATTYGSLSGTTFTTNEASGMAGVTIDGIIGTTATSFAYGACLSLTSTASGTITITVPTGYNITGYKLTARSNTYAVPYTLTPAEGGSAVTTSTGGVELEVNGISVNSTSFTYSAASANSFYIPSLMVSVVSATAATVNVTYALYESDGTTLVTSATSVQEANSEVNVPSSLTGYTYYDYTTEGTIGDTDCTITVTRTLKAGVVIGTSNLSNSKCYTITTNGRGAWVVPSEATAVTSTTKAGLAYSAEDSKQQFAFINYEDNYYLYSVSEKKFISKSGNYTTLTATPGDNVTLLASSGSYSYPVVVALQNGAYQAGISNGYNPAVITHYNSLSDDGNRAYISEAADFDPTEALAALEEFFHPSYTVTYVVKDASNNVLFTSEPEGTTLGATITTLPAEYQITTFYSYNTIDLTISETNTTAVFTATLKDDAPVKFTTDATSPYYYNLNIRSKYLVYNAEATGEVTLQTTSEPFNANASWAFIGEPYAGFKVINKTKGTDSYLTYTSVETGGNSGNNNIQFVAAADFTNQYWNIDTNSSGIVLRMKENTNIYFHHDNGNNFLRTCSLSEWAYVHTDAGSTIVAASDEDVLFALYDALSAVTFGDGLGEYTAEGYTATEVQSVLAGVATIIANEQTTAYADAYNALADLANISTLNMPTAGYYRIKGKTSGMYLAAGLASNNKFAMSTATDASTIFYFDGNTLVNFGSGMSNGMTANAWAWVTGNVASTVVFQDGQTNGGYVIQSTNAYFYDNGDNSSSADRGSSNNGNIRYNSWALEQVSALPLSLNAVGSDYYATLCVPYNVTLDGAEAYTLTLNAEESELDLGEALTTVPAGTPVMLKGTAATATATLGTDYVNAPVASTLTGVFYATTVAAETDYFLGQKDGEVGFYKWTGTTLKANRAYLPASAVAAEVKGLKVNFGDTDAIKAIENGQLTTGNEAIYNLAGQRVSKATRGIYVKNGRKVVIK